MGAFLVSGAEREHRGWGSPTAFCCACRCGSGESTPAHRMYLPPDQPVSTVSSTVSAKRKLPSTADDEVRVWARAPSDPKAMDLAKVIHHFPSRFWKVLLLDHRERGGSARRQSNPLAWYVSSTFHVSTGNSPSLRFRHYVGVRSGFAHEVFLEDAAVCSFRTCRRLSNSLRATGREWRRKRS